MKLIVYRNTKTYNNLAKHLFNGTKPPRGLGTKILDVIADSPLLGFTHLRGYQFDEVLWVGYEDHRDVGFKAPMELLAQTHGAKYHYCKPSEPQKAPSKLSYGITLPQGSKVDFKTLQPSSETDDLVDVMRCLTYKSYEELPESVRTAFASGDAVLLVKGV